MSSDFKNDYSDEDTLQYLLNLSSSKTANSEELQNRLQILKNRLCQFQHPFGSTFWSNLLTDVTIGTLIVKQEIGKRTTLPNASNGGEILTKIKSYPNGLLHIQTLSTLLHISNEDAARFTLASLQSSEKSQNHQDLSTEEQGSLASTYLISHVQQYYIREHISRLQSLTECLRMEIQDEKMEDEPSECPPEITSFLNDLDDMYITQWSPTHDNSSKDTTQIAKKSDQSRGLLRMLLVSACCGISGDKDQKSQVTVEALEALLVLFYGKRLTLSRWDFMVLLSAMESKDFFGSSNHIPKISQLVALICSEALSLWKFTSSTNDDKTSYSSLIGIEEASESNTLIQDIKSIQQLLERNAMNINHRIQSKAHHSLSLHESPVEAPEAIVMFSFGLLLLLTQSKYSHLDESISSNLREVGMKCIREANDTYGAFVYLEWTLQTLLPSRENKILRMDHNGNYSSKLTNRMDVEDDEEEVSYDDAASVVYSSIGREIITATISAFYLNNGAKLSKLPIADIKMLSSLIACSFRNQTTSRISFWNTWYEHNYQDIDEKSENGNVDAICFLMEGAHHLAVATMQNKTPDVAALFSSIAPLFELVSTLVCDLQTLTFAMEGIAGESKTPGVVLLPPFLISSALSIIVDLRHHHVYTTKEKSLENSELMASVENILCSISMLCHTGGQQFFTLVVNDFEKNYGNATKLPSYLFLIAIHAPDSRIAQYSLSILSHLLLSLRKDLTLSTSLHLSTSQCIEGYGLNSNGFSSFLPNIAKRTNLTRRVRDRGSSTYQSAMALMNIARSLCSKLCEVLASKKISNVVESYIKIILNGANTACDILVSTAFSNEIFSSNEAKEELELNFLCSQVIRSALHCIQPYLLHSDPIISSACSNARHSIIFKLASTPQLGQIIASQATLPVASALRGSLMVHFCESKTKEINCEKGGKNRFGEWESFAAVPQKRTADKDERISFDDYQRKLVENIHLVDYKMGFMQSFYETQNHGRSMNGNIDEYKKTLLKLTACEATKILLLWTKFAEEIIRESDESESNDESLSLVSQGSSCKSLSHDKHKFTTQEDLMNLSPIWKVICAASFNPTNQITDLEGGEKKLLLMNISERDVDTNIEVLQSSGKLWPKNLSWLTLLSRYILCDENENYSSLPSTQTLDLLILINDHVCSVKDLAPNLLHSSLNGGMQLHSALKLCLEQHVDTRSSTTLQKQVLLKALKFLSLLLQSKPNFAGILLLGRNALMSRKTSTFEKESKSTHLHVCDLFLKILNDAASRTTSKQDEDFAVASQAVFCISVLYGKCRDEISTGKNPRPAYFSNASSPALKYFTDKEDFFMNLLQILEKKETLINMSEDSVDGSIPSTNKRSNILHLLSSTMRIISHELYATSSDSEKCAVRKSMEKTMQIEDENYSFKSDQFFKLITSQLDGTALSATKYQALREAFGEIGISREFILPYESKCTSIDEISTVETHELECMRKVVPTANVTFQNITSSWKQFILSNKMSNMQTCFVESWTQYIGTTSMIRFQDSDISLDSSSKNLSNINWCASQVQLIIDALETHYTYSNEAIISNTSPPYVKKNVVALASLYSSGKVATELLEAALSSLYNILRFSHVCTLDFAQNLQGLFNRLMNVSEKLFAMLKPSQYKSAELSVLQNNIVNSEVQQLTKKGLLIGCKLRVQTMSIALVFLDLIDSIESSRGLRSGMQKEMDARLILADLVCDCIRLVKHCHHSNHSTSPYDYNFATSDDLPEANLSFTLFSSSLAVLNSLLRLQPSSSISRLTISKYYTDLTASFRKWNLIPTLLEHFTISSKAAATMYTRLSNDALKSVDETTIIHRRSLSIVSSILHFVNVASASTSTIDVAILLMKNGSFINAMIKNPLFQCAGKHWCSMSNSGNHDTRGYLVHVGSNLKFGNPSKQKNSSIFPLKQAEEDSVHEVWRLALKTVTSLISMHSGENKFLDFGIDFFYAFDGVILSAISGGNDSSNVNKPFLSDSYKKIDQSSSSLRPVFTKNNILESISSLSLISDLYKNPCIQQFEKFSSSSSQAAILKTVRFAVRSLSTFLGASGIARELFKAVSRLNRAMESANSAASPNKALMIQQIQKVINFNAVMLAGGLPSARHEAISNAHYAISTARCITSNDFEESKYGNSKEVENSNDNSLEGFINHVNNEFSLKMEYLAAKALYFAFSILTRANPSSSTFIYFDCEEATRMNPSSFVDTGTIIALRPRTTSNFMPASRNHGKTGNPDNLRYACVIRCRNDEKVWDVEYLSNEGHESNVCFKRLAGVKDITKKKKILNFAPAPKSPSIAFSTEISIGHLILALRWCKERTDSDEKDNDNKEDSSSVKCLTNLASLVLAREMKVHDDLESSVKVDENEIRILNSQLYELFGDIYNKEDPDQLPQTPQTPTNRDKTGLEYALNNETLKAVLFSLRKSLVSAKEEHEAIAQERLGKGTSPSPGSGRRRSPFRGYGITM